MLNVKDLVHRGLGFVQRNSPYILTGLGCAGVVSTAIMTGQAAVKARDTLVEYELDKTDEVYGDRIKATPGHMEIYNTTINEKVRLTWKYFIPPALMGATSMACIIGAQTVNTKRHAALASLYTLTDQTLKDYQEKVVEHFGKNKEQKVRDDMAQDILDAHPVNPNNIIRTPHGDTLCFDVYSGRYFTHDIESLRRIQNDFNHDLMGVMWCSLNDLYYTMGLEEVKMGNDLGWTVDELLDFRFSSKLASDGTPCLVIDYDLTPRYLKGNMWGGQ